MIANSKSIELQLEKLIEICHSNLNRSTICLDYLFDQRSISMASIKKHKIGFFPQNVRTLINYVSPDILKQISVIDYSENSSPFSEFFYLIFPIYSEYNIPIGIAGRTLLNEDERDAFDIPKYKNSSYKKSQYLYGLHYSKNNIIQNQNVYIVEGFFDYIALDSNQISNAVAICGTAFSRNHLLKLARYTDQITFILDRDEAGLHSMERIKNNYSDLDLKLKFLKLPESCKDVDDYFRKGGNKNNFLKDLVDYLPGSSWL